MVQIKNPTDSVIELKLNNRLIKLLPGTSSYELTSSEVKNLKTNIPYLEVLSEEYEEVKTQVVEKGPTYTSEDFKVTPKIVEVPVTLETKEEVTTEVEETSIQDTNIEDVITSNSIKDSLESSEQVNSSEVSGSLDEVEDISDEVLSEEKVKLIKDALKEKGIKFFPGITKEKLVEKAIENNISI